MPVRERSLVEKVGMAAEGPPLGLLAALKDCAASDETAIIAMKPAIWGVVTSRFLGTGIRLIVVLGCVPVSRIKVPLLLPAVRPGAYYNDWMTLSRGTPLWSATAF